jgi:hypothetical protein
MESAPPASYHPPYPVGTPTPFPQHAREDEKKGIIVIVAIVIIVIVLLVALPIAFLWAAPIDSDDFYSETVTVFPTIEISLQHGDDNGDKLSIKHTSGDPLDWSNFKIIISDSGNSAVMTDLSSLGQIAAGEKSTITESGISGFSDIDYAKGSSYQVEIYNLKENKRVYNRDNLICE